MTLSEKVMEPSTKIYKRHFEIYIECVYVIFFDDKIKFIKNVWFPNEL